MLLRPEIAHNLTEHIPEHTQIVSLNLFMLPNELIPTPSCVGIADQQYFKWAPGQRRGGFEWYAHVVTKLHHPECDLICGIKIHDQETTRCFFSSSSRLKPKSARCCMGLLGLLGNAGEISAVCECSCLYLEFIGISYHAMG